MAVKTDERLEFLGDIITTAVEGGTGYWAQVSQYQYVHDGEVRVYCGGRVGDGARAVLHELKDDESGYKAEELVVDTDLIAKGIGALLKNDARINSQMKANIGQASRENDAGMIDADDADAIVQFGLFGELVYG